MFDNHTIRITSFFGIINFIILLCVFHKAYFSVFVLIPAIMLITNKFKNNKYFREEDLIVIVFSIYFAYILQFIIYNFFEFNVFLCILVSISVTSIITCLVLAFSFLIALISKPIFHYLKMD